MFKWRFDTIKKLSSNTCFWIISVQSPTVRTMYGLYKWDFGENAIGFMDRGNRTFELAFHEKTIVKRDDSWNEIN